MPKAEFIVDLRFSGGARIALRDDFAKKLAKFVKSMTGIDPARPGTFSINVETFTTDAQVRVFEDQIKKQFELFDAQLAQQDAETDSMAAAAAEKKARVRRTRSAKDARAEGGVGQA